MTSHSSALLSVLQNWELVHIDASEIVSSNNMLSSFTCINGVDIGTISTRWEDTHHFPTELASRGSPKSRVDKRSGTISNLLASLNIVEELGVSLIDSSDVLGIMGPVKSSDG